MMMVRKGGFRWRSPLQLHVLHCKRVYRCYPNSVLSHPPVIGFFLIAQVPDASDMRSMALAFRPPCRSRGRQRNSKRITGSGGPVYAACHYIRNVTLRADGPNGKL
jgi:hypothetical protein